MEWKNIKLEQQDSLFILTINRPEVRNALDTPTVKEINEALDTLDLGKPGVLIVTGAGDKAFVAGADIADLRTRTKAQALEAINTTLFARIENLAWPVIAAVNGFALGGGCEIALACDIRIASESARFGLPEANLGIIPAAGGTQRLPRLIGLSRAKHWVLTGDIYNADEAYRVGLVSCVVPPDKLMETAIAVARKILARAPLAVRLAKLSLNASSQVPLDGGLIIEMLAQGILYESKDKYEGMTAFLEKRKANFTGE
ncbi:MAG: enoyl-CoA hydratase/isomerase family protein [Acidobacteria bacterium]|nr:enoyl-CoA hydratase/isomerase family protein [Acidobacteriota bacterium]